MPNDTAPAPIAVTGCTIETVTVRLVDGIGPERFATDAEHGRARFAARPGFVSRCPSGHEPIDRPDRRQLHSSTCSC